jgi:DNA-binding NarL/FixJ family response regulator
MIRVIVVDDQELARAGLRHVLRGSAGFQIVAEAADGVAAVEAVTQHDADVVVMDVRMPELDGIAATAAIREHPDAPPVLILTTFGDEESVAAALRAGAAGFALKDAPGEELQQAVRAVASGEGWLDPAVTPHVLAAFSNTSSATPVEIVARLDLTSRELEVLQLVGRGRTNSEIADELVISEATVKTHLSHIFDKLGVRDRAGAIVYAFDAGVVRPGS